MVAFNNTEAFDIDDNYGEYETFERIRPQRESPMPVGSCRSMYRGRRRNKTPNRIHRAPQHCRGAALRHVRKWR